MAYVIGLMSGTSLDGIDVALVDIQGKGYDSQVKLLDFMTLPFAQSVREEIVDSLSLDRSNVQLICSLNFKLGELFADAVEAICRRNQLDFTSVSVIGSHGQTIYHQPQSNGQYVASTLQIGEPAIIAYRTNTTVISNFRTMDMAAGGQGAPLVPYTELIMYRDQEKSRLLQNIGGIGNVTVIPKAAQLHDVYAFDTGPGNMIIDEICRVCFGTAYDKDGAWAAKGVVNEALLEQCMNIDYMQLAPPKSTGRELFGKQFVERIIRENTHLSPYDLLATMTMFTASSIAYHYKKFIFPTLQVDEVIIGGGGSYNKTLLSMLQQQLGNTCKVITQEDVGLSSEAKEAVAFALLAHETLHRLPSNVPTATGAREPVILGNVTYPPRSV
ncbi:anhydro-N-acetylmuramic acid kinase AnmK [Brevibacillus laterosporus]|uniref:anhydro-N-acetylmuramic acid kinase AnmK n=1 Tax=Brevibacillus TaxID=55080 RepID=UPI000CE556E1|nr:MULTISPECIES: anhydro-N-acetylmuramic acid kinase AnmK [Brevibacillus]MBG9786324.1 anhydro-N-acetylmuramic acid kinase [Brevibacillus laterosporus]MCG7318746.1 anhydro-N-acetylmuramic acid kinase [Brevibacillus laterosporus]MCR8940056.1 anhydro-N-acetylmuramic acid kinase AnmK [Brevibacillus laterosporus]MCZ0842696.1 anhydro-N-acetylmuramic acid kinase AnmK [Brevibacillus laterosporus]MCZ0846583.1 anhydro-N-acetylmuramic acid kinase AnmK [Brevibacillus laterosporus]